MLIIKDWGCDGNYVIAIHFAEMGIGNIGFSLHGLFKLRLIDNGDRDTRCKMERA
ncbi:hypothetical protein D3C85_1116690 [compost metagenome]